MAPVQLIIFDLDGVLIETKQLHYETLNEVLGPDDAINYQDHLTYFDGLSTRAKLKKLNDQHHKWNDAQMEALWERKQQLTMHRLRNIEKNSVIFDCVQQLYKAGYQIAVASNCVRSTLSLVLKRLDIKRFCSYTCSSDEVEYQKPHPAMYWKLMSKCGATPETTLILEDSPRGLFAAHHTGARVMQIHNPHEVTYEMICTFLRTPSYRPQPRWHDTQLNVVIPMAGAGHRFERAGYSRPKPLIDVRQRPMIQVAVESLGINARYIYVVQRAHRISYQLDVILNMITPNCEIVEVDGVTEGAACTILTAKHLVNSDAPLFIANSDQYVEWSPLDFFYAMRQSQVDGGIVTFTATDPKWSFAQVDSTTQYVIAVAEKTPISTDATVGYYYWKRGSDFVRYAEQMIAKNIRVNNEFYVCPVYNEAIQDGQKIRAFPAQQMWGLGTPEDLTSFLTEH